MMTKGFFFFFFFFCATLYGLSKYTLTFDMCDIKLGSLNINGAREDAKRVSLFSLFKVKKLSIFFYKKRIALLKMKLNGRKSGMGKFFSVIRVATVPELEFCLRKIFYPFLVLLKKSLKVVC